MRTPLWLAIPGAVLSGFALSAAFPSADLWWLAPFAITGYGLCLLGRNLWTSLFVGMIFGATFWLALITWLTLYLGAVPWLALALLQALFIAVTTPLITLTLSRGNDIFTSLAWRILAVPTIAASIWVCRELVTSVWPYGGFSWGKLAFAQSQSPFAHITAFIGDAGLSFVIAFIGFALVQALRTKYRPAVLFPFLIAVAVIAIPPLPIVTSGSMTVLAVQGNSKAGLFDRSAPGAIMNDHVSGTFAHQGESVDLVVWPENAADLNPLEFPQSAAILSQVSREMNAPIMTGAITTNAHGEYFNSSLLWTDRLLAQYDKIHPVPFAEYMPNREIWRTFQPELVDLVTRDYSFGKRSNVVEVSGVPVGVSICFDITDDAQISQMISGGASLIIAQTNNADFGRTSENLQQLAIARLRAIETGRSVVNISTVGSSAVISPTGTTIASIPPYQAGQMLTPVPLSTALTPAVALSPVLDYLFIVLAFLGLLFIMIRHKF